jgi:hypothetical protein
MAMISERMGVTGGGYGLPCKMLDAVAGDEAELLALAWACIDQASSRETLRSTARALEAVEELSEEAPETLRTGEEPA